ncbi:excisionase family DNA binding protein [Allocatelliglobosispora scoriae]|uniref:Excisionase family DNA binding protein n=1 Tax=Allocatelliglobosispora scoriae TaxID=643052 RepID=A0A841BUG0_9ACTN|nr:helix-turn-helix domain-containing protein [Allocatelliglobosispora scoriae]MBB5871086.1 excisionase family DNA binding protein [Allocatelliglobosispora scoriae]
MEPLLTLDEAAAFLRTKPRFMRRLVAERRITFHKVGRFVRFDLTDLVAYVAAGRVEPIRPALHERRELV